MVRPALAVIDTAGDEPHPCTCQVTRLYKPADVAALLNISRSAVYELLQARELVAVNLTPAAGTGRGRMRIRSDALQAYIDRLEPAQ